MKRTIGAVVLGYLAMAVLLFVIFTIAYVAMGTERAFQAGTYDVSTLWLALSIVVGFAAAVVGGQVATRIGGERAVRSLLVVVVLLGLATAVMGMMTPPRDPGPRAGDVPVMQAMNVADSPAWVEWANIVIGAAGTLIGGRVGASAARATTATRS